METQIVLKAPGADLEARLRTTSKINAVVITHPHPLYGGDMNNSVVSIVADAYAQEGWSVLRFNFRGTGASKGHHEDGIGEQKDVRAAIDYLTAGGYRQIDLAGYSFGAWVLAVWARNNAAHPHRIFMVAPPVAFVDFDQRAAIPGLRHVITGSLDDLAPPGRIQSALPQWHQDAKLCVIQGADHSFWGHFQTLRQTMAKIIVAP
ncbi:MAG: alpha/beta hydrolase [Desulfobacteraceae bacterium]|nr:MAG: alpha/beta hydrolase [Desulfobacteraceae bacterium]